MYHICKNDCSKLGVYEEWCWRFSEMFLKFIQSSNNKENKDIVKWMFPNLEQTLVIQITS